jgi:glutamate 5-kinase
MSCKNFDSKKIKRIVIKAGTSVLTDGGRLDEATMGRIVAEIAQLWSEGKEVMLVTSGAIASGMSRLGIKSKPKEVSMQQACAAVGQGALMHAYEKLFSRHGIATAQVLLTNDDFSVRERYLNVMATFEQLLRARVVPIINENDVVSNRELAQGASVFGDNDELSALVASKMKADLLLLLTDVDGLYDRNPKEKGAALIRDVDAITPELEAAAGKAGATGRGGMKNKLRAAKLATSSGAWVAMARGKKESIIASVLACKEGTMFCPADSQFNGKEQWIAFASPSAGSIEINTCAMDALAKKGASLLAVGVVSAKGTFGKGDVVDITRDGRSIARGKVNYSCKDLQSIAGKKSDEARKILGYANEVVDRENLVMIKKSSAFF